MLQVIMKGIRKIYPDGVYALKGVDFDLRKQEIHGLLGENGAGKSTLMRILYGQIQPTGGEILVEGKPVSFESPRDALRHGIGMVFQHFTLVPEFTALENITLGMEPGEKGILDLDVARGRILKLMEESGLHVDLDMPIRDLPVGTRQRVEILKLLYRNVNVLILDEPTSVLTPLEVRDLFKTLDRLRSQGKSIVFVTHKLKEAKSICDRITVLRGGVRVSTVEASKVGIPDLAKMMVGREVFLKFEKKPVTVGGEILKVLDLHVLNDMGLPAVKGVSFTVKGGEIFGIAGVQGNGQSELAEALVGLRRVEKGRVIIDGKDMTNKPSKLVYQTGVSYIPENRVERGLIGELSVMENLILNKFYDKPFSDGLRLNSQTIRSYALDLIRKFNIMTPSEKVMVKYLSGGNQQRVIIARELSRNPKLIIAAEPTMGLDVAATEFVRSSLLRMRDEGKAVLLISSDLDEVLSLSDRIAVMYEGRFMGVGRPDKYSIEEIGMMMGGVPENELRKS